MVIWGNSLTNEKHQPFQFVAVLRGHRGPVKGVAWDPVGRYLATQADDIGVRVWRTADWQPENKVSTPFTNVRAVFLNSDGRYMLENISPIRMSSVRLQIRPK